VGHAVSVTHAPTYVPFMDQLFSTAPIGLKDWGLVVAVGLVGYLVIELDKWLRRKPLDEPCLKE